MSNDDFVLNSIVESIDQGIIFEFALNVAKELLKIPNELINSEEKSYDPYCASEDALSPPFNCSFGDIALPTAAFDALNSILFSNATNTNQEMGYICGSAYDDDWHDADPNAPGKQTPFGPPGTKYYYSLVTLILILLGCAIIAVQVSGGQNRVINEYYFQPFSPSTFVAFSNTIYSKNSFQAMFTPPTVLIQLYYTCVMTKKDAFFNSLGLAQANSVVYTSLFFSFLMVIVVNYLNYIKKVRPKIRTIQQIAIDEAKEKADLDARILRVVQEFEAMRSDMLNGSTGFTYDVSGITIITTTIIITIVVITTFIFI